MPHARRGQPAAASLQTPRFAGRSRSCPSSGQAQREARYRIGGNSPFGPASAVDRAVSHEIGRCTGARRGSGLRAMLQPRKAVAHRTCVSMTSRRGILSTTRSFTTRRATRCTRPFAACRLDGAATAARRSAARRSQAATEDAQVGCRVLATASLRQCPGGLHISLAALVGVLQNAILGRAGTGRAGLGARVGEHVYRIDGRGPLGPASARA